MNGYAVRIFYMLALQFMMATCKISPVEISKSRISPQTLTHTPFTLPDGEQIALEVTNQLLPPSELSQQIGEEIKLIKYKYRVVSKISHNRKWVPGELITTRISEEQIRQVNTSEYGPFADITFIDLQPFYEATILSFSKPYNPLSLGEIMNFKYGFASSPNTVYFNGDDIFYDLSTKTYIFKQRGCVSESANENPPAEKANEEDCKEETNRHYWEFVVSEKGNVRLVKEYDIDENGNRKLDLKYSSVYNAPYY